MARWTITVDAERAFGEETVMIDAEAVQIVADVGQAEIQAGIEHQAVVGVAEQATGIGNQRINVFFLVAALAFVIRNAFEDVDWRRNADGRLPVPATSACNVR